MTLLALSLLAVVVVPSAQAAKKKKPKGAKVTFSVSKTTRTATLKSGLVVKVKSTGATSVKLTTAKSLTRSVSVKFKKKGTRTIKLKLATKGKTALGACGNVKVKVSFSAVYKPTKKSKAKTVKGTRTYTWVGAPCPVKPLHVDAANTDRCDPIGSGQCLSPFPSNFYTVPDASRPTGLRVNLNRASMPVNKDGTPIDPAEWNTADGFSSTAPINVQIPGLNSKAAFDASGFTPVTDMAQYARTDNPLVVVDLSGDATQRVPVWAEMDANADNDADRLLEIHPSQALIPGHRYGVMLRNLRNAAGQTIAPSTVFRAYRDNVITDNAGVEQRRKAMNDLFAALSPSGIAKADLTLAWDFTVASTKDTTDRMLTIRDNAFGQLGDTNLADGVVAGTAPVVTVDSVMNFATSDAPDPLAPGVERSARGARRVSGTVRVPCYLTSDNCAPGASFNYAGDGKTPVQRTGNYIEAPIRCIIPRASENGPIATGTRPVIYGHGLFGTAAQGWRGNKIDYAYESGLTICATEFAGMADEDVVPATINMIQDLSLFKNMADRIQQGLLDFTFVGRAMVNGAGMSAKRAFQNGDGTTTDGSPVIDPAKQLAYFGISEGGILGGALTAIEPDATNTVLNVPGMSYATLLPRSTDFAEFASLLYPSYPDQKTRPQLFTLMQMLWDRGEASGYVHNMTTNPLPNTPPHRVLLQAAFGDHQVANVTAETEARTLGLRARGPVVSPGRSTDVTPFWGIETIAPLPFPGSGISLWDTGPPRLIGTPGVDERWIGTDAPPTENKAPVSSTDGGIKDGVYVGPTRGSGDDPHGAPGASVEARQQLGAFLNTGSMTETCDPAKACFADGWTGP